MANDLVDHLEPPIELFHQLAGAVDDLEDVDAFLVAADLVGELAAAPVLGLFDLAVHARHDRFDLRVQFGHLLVGRVGRQDVDELVLPVSYVSFWTYGTSTRRCALSLSGKESISIGRVSVRGRRARVERVHHRRDASATNISAASAARVISVSSIGLFAVLEPREHVIREIAPALAAPDAQPQPREIPSSQCAMTDFKPLCPPADPRARARSLPSGSCASSTTTAGRRDSISK